MVDVLDMKQYRSMKRLGLVDILDIKLYRSMKRVVLSISYI